MRKAVFIGVAVGVVALLYVSSLGPSTSSDDGPWSKSTQSAASGVYSVAIVADLDTKSRIDGRKPEFKSFLREGTLTRKVDGSWSITWEKPHVLKSKHNEAGRGMELSELVKYSGKLYTFDDRSGLVFEITYGRRTAVPRYVLMEGDGETSKGQKTEWATVKDGQLYTGSFGKEYVDSAGKITSTNNLWVSILNKHTVTHEDWTQKYNVMRGVTNSLFPAYLIIETIVWSPHKRKWFVLPRRVSTEKYDEKTDEKRGSNIILVCNEPITECSKFTAGSITPERGFSSAKFVPGTKDEIMVALKSEENEAEGTQNTYIMVFDTNGKVLLEETPIPSEEEGVGYKYEGIEFI